MLSAASCFLACDMLTSSSTLHVVQSVEPKTSPVKEAPFASNAAPYANGTTPEKHLEPSSKSTSPTIPAAHGGHNNNYHRSEGQNVGNFLTDRNSSRVLAPPGGRSNITFG